MVVVTTKGKNVDVPDKVIEDYMEKYELSENEAIQLYLEDNDLEENEELEELDSKAKKVKIDHGARSESSDKSAKKPRTVKISDEKAQFFTDLKEFLEDCGYNFEILKDNKLFSVKIGEKEFKLDLIETRKKK